MQATNDEGLGWAVCIPSAYIAEQGKDLWSAAICKIRLWSKNLRCKSVRKAKSPSRTGFIGPDIGIAGRFLRFMVAPY